MIGVEPNELHFSLEACSKKIVITNPTETRLALKVKTTNNKQYRVEPIYTTVEPKQTTEFEVMRLEGGQSTVDKLIFIHSPVSFLKLKFGINEIHKSFVLYWANVSATCKKDTA